ncbi:hypothetical protein U6A24_12270 [Aquimarina gracilis]|uniref:Bacteriocin-like protein n=1 Tax=Aquimarina gracilis TaxID=874422 RepID=A0ABU5ZWJ1_9FLAO|nr:hypothetical protein [Aquimarina gracilis]MEB3346244.1 hypothetical protein [Aquimarina gracilis]
MKKKGMQNIDLKKITIARINTDAMKNIEGGSSVLTSEYFENANGVVVDHCYHEK